MRGWVLVVVAATGCKLGFDEVGASFADAAQGDAAPSAGAGFFTSTSNGSISITLDAGISRERNVFLAVTAGSGGGPVACTDSRGNVYTIEEMVGPGGQAFMCSTKPQASFVAGDVLTATYPVFDGTSTIGMIAFETQSKNSSNVNSGNDASPTSLAVTVASGDEILGVIAWTGDAQLASFGSFTVYDEVDSQQGASSRHLVVGRHSAVSAGSEAAAATLTAPAVWDVLVATFPADN